MTKLDNFHANGVSFSDSSRADIDSLVEKIPNGGTLHLAILQPPYLDLISDGTKTIESRINANRSAPFGKVAVGDLILLKETGKPITNYFFAATVALFNLNEVPIQYVREEYGYEIAAWDEEAFWNDHQNSSYATLIKIGEQGTVPPLAVMKRDQRGWVTFTRDTTLFENES